MAKGEGRQFPPFNIINLLFIQRLPFYIPGHFEIHPQSKCGIAMLVFPKFRKLYVKTVYNSLTERLPILIIPSL